MAYEQGEKLYNRAIMESENMNLDEVYDALDLFNNASKIAFAEVDLEMEARCEAQLGMIFEKALKKEDKAMLHYNNMVRLEVAMRPKDITRTDWYKKAKKAKDTIAENRRLAEEAA